MILQGVLHKPSRSHLALLLSTFIVLLGGGMTLLWQIHQGQSSRADGGSIVGPPTLPAETVDKIFASVGSPMVGTGKMVEQTARQANIDDAFALAVWWVETNDGQAGVGLNNRNPGAVQGSNGYILYPSYADAASDWFTVLRSRYISRGLISVYTICYPYVGTSHSLEWANKVVSYMLRYRSLAPAPTPVPTRDHAPISLQFAPSFGPASDKNDAVGDVPRTATTTVQTGASPLFSTPGTLLLMISGLLAALVLAMIAMNVRRRTTLIQPGEPVTESLAPVMELPPLYVNEFSPIAEPTSSPSLPWWVQREQSQQVQEVQSVATPISSAEGLFAATGAGQVSAVGGHFHGHLLQQLAAGPISVIDGIPQLSFDDPVSVIDDVPQLSFDMAIIERQAGSYPTTEMLPPLYRPGLSLPGRFPEPVPAGLAQPGPAPELVAAGARPARAGGGLLRRYAMEQASET